ncbi:MULTISPECIES: thioesterase II family protein [unclassified Amycolatopsis]|uniref:thioesterase II family protein n=1 Tax=unclassified Amycolatopsis TaxID=2618356 RepID=UPI001C69C154|nr:alpha/beta fold hydrolase [Amycolatopsis sp. DSM 110486]QYN17767.1 alpha/beta fold hydrolase [Amycolatopsis sp. DSM 110486]
MSPDVDIELWTRRYHPAPEAAVQLVCFPHAGGSASFYFPVSKALSPGVDVIAVQYPGRQDRRSEPCLDSVGELADALVAPLLRYRDRPMAFFGHSMGASVAFEVACRLEARDVVPIVVFASGRRAPSRRRDETVHQRDDDGLLAEIRSLSGTDAQILGNEEMLRMILPAIRSDYRAAETYRWAGTGPIAAPIHVHVGETDPKVSFEEAESWQVHTTGRTTVTTHPGGHFYLNDRAPQLIRAISDALPR